MATATACRWYPSSEKDMDELDYELLRALEDSSSDTEESDTDSLQPPGKRQKLQPDTPALAQSAPSQVCSTSGRDSSAEAAVPGVFAGVPPEVLLRVLGFLSAEDLTCCAQLSRFFRTLCSDDVLWRRLFFARWGRTPGDGSKSAECHNWKASYMERDTAEILEVQARVPPSLREFYVQMTAANRSKRLGRAHSDDMMTGSSHVADQIASWHRQHGFDILKVPASHSCTGRCTFCTLGPSVFICERSGWAHVCDDTCRERFVDDASDMLVCPVSGRCFERMMTEWEEEAHTRLKGEERAEEGAEDCGISGRLGQAYVAGYNCTNERELQQVCGVRF